MSDKEKILPCPFCGGYPRIISYGYADGFIIEHPTGYEENTSSCPIGNDEGKGIGVIFYETRQEAIQVWNKRVYPEQSKIGEWILCSERMPEWENKSYLVCLKNGGVFMAFCSHDGEFKEISTIGIRDFHKDNPVIAWMDLPDAYRKGEAL